MFPKVLEMAAAEIARLTPDTPPALWLPYVGYALTAAGSLLIAAGTLALTRSKLASAAAAIAFVATPAEPVGLLLAALAALGAVGLLTAKPIALPRWVIPSLLLCGLLFSARGGLLLWMFAGGGLWAVGSVISGRASRVAGIMALTIITIFARVPAAMTSAPPLPAPLGHDRATLTSMRALLSNIPTGSYLVRDDTLTSILVRAAQRDFRRARVFLEPIDNDAANIREQLKFRRVFTLPHAQRSLAMQGFKIVDSLHVADRGLAEVVAGSDCVTANQTWQTAISVAGQRDLAFVSEKESRRGPVVIYLAGDHPIHIGAANWPARTMRGFSPRTFDMSRSQDRQDLERQRIEDGGPWTVDLNAKSITRIALWRMPDAALEMQITLSAPAAYAAVKLAPEADGPVSVCPIFPVTVSAIR